MPSYEVEVTVVQTIIVTVEDMDSIEEAEAYAKENYEKGSYFSEDVTEMTVTEV